MPRFVLRLGWSLLVLFAGCERKPPNCSAIHDMKVCERTKECQVSSIWVIGLPDANPPPEHHQYECVLKQR